MKLAIDASNIRSGGGLTHLLEVTEQLSCNKDILTEVRIWAPLETLKKLPSNSLIIHEQSKFLNHGWLGRVIWQIFIFKKKLQIYKCDLLLVPGGSSSINFYPKVVISQNLLPFQFTELLRFGVSIITVKMILLRLFQSYTFKTASKVIFLSSYAQKVIKSIVRIKCPTCIIPLGVSSNFFRLPKPQKKISEYGQDTPYKILYVSSIEPYKHHAPLILAINKLIDKGYPIKLILVGEILRGKRKFIDLVNKNRALKNAVEIVGLVPYEQVNEFYSDSDMYVFSSSCENMPNTLTEPMASGLPIACSNMGVMPEILGDGGLYYNPLDVDSIVSTLEKLLLDPKLRGEIAKRAFHKAQSYSWPATARMTVDEIFKTYLNENLCTKH